MNKIKVFFLSYAILSSLSLFSQELKHKKNDYTFLGSEKPSDIALKKNTRQLITLGFVTF